ncbi:hypothetical protein J6590_069284 [Homalodisca vitripennis]|nr:hypothetical protein J6590_069284 [Homalodisca vitripennis]
MMDGRTGEIRHKPDDAASSIMYNLGTLPALLWSNGTTLIGARQQTVINHSRERHNPQECEIASVGPGSALSPLIRHVATALRNTLMAAIRCSLLRQLGARYPLSWFRTQLTFASFTYVFYI